MTNTDATMMGKNGMKRLRGQADPRIQVEQVDQEGAEYSKIVALESELAEHVTVLHRIGICWKKDFWLEPDLCARSSQMLLLQSLSTRPAFLLDLHRLLFRSMAF